MVLAMIWGCIMEKHILSVLVRNSSGVLTRVSGLFSRRGFNIDSLTVGRTEEEDISRMTIVIAGDMEVVEQVIKQLNKLEDIINIQELISDNSVYRELVLIKVKADAEKRAEINEVVKIFRSKIVDVSQSTLTVELTGDESKINALIRLLNEYGIKEVVNRNMWFRKRRKIYERKRYIIFLRNKEGGNNMAMTMTQKILAKHAGLESVEEDNLLKLNWI